MLRYSLLSINIVSLYCKLINSNIRLVCLVDFENKEIKFSREVSHPMARINLTRTDHHQGKDDTK